jgi:phytoene/squalene synthetase
MKIRKVLNYSPYYFITLVKISCKDYEEGFKHANKIGDYLKKNLSSTTKVLGPSMANIFRINNVYHYQCIIKYKKDDKLNTVLREIDNIYDKKVPVTEIGRRVYKDCMRFKLQKESFEEVLFSLKSDCPNPINRPAQKELNQYFQGTAITPTYLILKVIAEFDDDTNNKLATQIGRAIEITNILKNTKEDMVAGHVYIPCELLTEAEIDKDLASKDVLTHTNLHVARQKLADIARKSFAEAYRLLEENNNKNSKPIIYMLNLYQKYSEIMDNRGWEIISPKPQLKLKDNIKLVIKTMLSKGY